MDLSKLSDAELEAIVGSGTPATPAGPDFGSMSTAELEAIAGQRQVETLGEPLIGGASPNDHRSGEILARSVLKGGGSGFLGLATLGADAGINLAYGAKKLAAKTGLVDAPNPDSYYGPGGGYFPTTSAVSSTIDRGLDAAGLAKPETMGERAISAVTEGAAGGVGGFLAGRVAQAGRGLGAFAANAPAPVQAASGAVAGAAGQGTAEAMADPSSPLAGLPEWTPAAVGMLGGAASGSALGRAAQRAGQAAAVPTRDALETAKRAAYGRADASGVDVSPTGFARLHDTIRQNLDAEGIFRDIDPGPAATRILQPFENSVAAGAPVPATRLDALRKHASAGVTSADTQERRVARIVRNTLDDFVERQAQPGDFLEPRPGAAGQMLGDYREGRELTRRIKKDTALENAMVSAEDRAGSTGTGANAQNAGRQDLRPMIKPDSNAARRMGFTPDETDQARSIVRGGVLENTLRTLGKLAPTGPVSAIPTMAGMSAGIGIGGGTGAALSLAVPIGGYLAKGAAERIQRNKINRLGETVRRGYQVDSPSGMPGAAMGAAGGFLANDDRTPMQVRVRDRRYR